MFDKPEDFTVTGLSLNEIFMKENWSANDAREMAQWVLRWARWKDWSEITTERRSSNEPASNVPGSSKPCS